MRFFARSKLSKNKIACGEILKTGAIMMVANKTIGALADGHYFMTPLQSLELAYAAEHEYIQILVKIGRGQYVSSRVQLNGHFFGVFDAVFQRIGTSEFFLTFNGKPVSMSTRPMDVNLQNGSVLVCSLRICGGMKHETIVKPKIVDNYFAAPAASPVSKYTLQAIGMSASVPWVKPFSERAKEFALRKDYRPIKATLNSGTPSRRGPVYVASPKFVGVGPFDGGWMSYVSKAQIDNDVFKTSQRLAKQMRKNKRFELESFEKEFDLRASLEKHVDVDILNLVEDLSILCLQLFRSRTNFDRATALTVFLKLRTGKSLTLNAADVVSDLLNDVFDLQSDEESKLLEQVTSVRELIGNWDRLQESSMAQSAMKVFKYAVSAGVMSAVGIKIDDHVSRICKKEVGGPMVGPNFVVALLDMITLLVQRALLYAKSGKWTTFFHGPESYGKWYDKCAEIKRHFMHVGDLEAHGTSYHAFVKDLGDAVETGRSILKYGVQASGTEILAVKKLLNDMLMIQADMFTYNEAQKSRRPPFGLLVFGKTSVGKSTFTEMLFQYMGRIMNLPTEEAFKYSRNPCDDFWSGWNSSKWFVCLDDVAYLNPNSQQTDNSLMEIIQLVNDVVLVPNQARLEDKGKNPVRARAVIATTNTKHLNAAANFSCPIAVQRRLPFVLTVEPKPEYACDHDAQMIDPAKLPPIVDTWPDFWHVTVERVVAAGENMASFDHLHKFTKIDNFLAWLKDTVDKFNEIQRRAGAGCKAMSTFILCDECGLTTAKCVCDLVKEYETQAGEYHLKDAASLGEDFSRTHIEGERVWIYDYTYQGEKEYNYTCTTTVIHKGEIERKFTAPAKISLDKRPVLENDDVEMAQVLGEIVHLQTRTGRFFNRMAGKAFRAYVGLYARSRFVRNLTNSAMEWKVVRKIVKYGLTHYASGKSTFDLASEYVRSSFIGRRWKQILAGIAGFTITAGVLTFAYKKYNQGGDVSKLSKAMDAHSVDGQFVPWEELSPEKREEASQLLNEWRATLQGARASVDDSFFPKSERENVWKRDDYETSSLDKTPFNVQYTQLPLEQVEMIIHRNVARITVSNGVLAREGNAFCVGGHLWVTSNHTMFGEGDLSVTLCTETRKPGATPNVTMILRQEDMFRMPKHDAAFFEVHCWEPKRDLRGLIRKPTLQGHLTGYSIGYDKNVLSKRNTIRAMELTKISPEGLEAEIPAWHGFASNLTVKGDCGMPIFTHLPHTTIVGMHTMGSPHQEVFMSALDSDMVEAAEKHFDNPIVQCATPVIAAPSRPKVIGPLRQFSPLRWLEQGSLRTFGSYQGFSVTSRSKVKPTLLGEKILQDRGWTQEFSAPNLRDWQPWRHALVDITQQRYGAVSPSKLRACSKAFVDDIVGALTKEQLATLEPLSDKATMNGIDGVKYIDKMNFKSSMGEPYNQTKKGWIRGEIGDKQFVDEVLERVQHVMGCYERGQRAAPVFSGKLKDEPRSHAKVKAGKVRVFTGAPADWSFVMRKYLLTLVKLIQENPLLFEASPGCTVQSLEWEQYFDYLVEFGIDRIIAGDYGKFDKKMEALLIREAFWILAQILKAAGWTDEEVMVVHCLGEDVAYAFVNFDGDLVMFFGSNPSGQPLTVIINCLVNALYMRYAFVELCPFQGSNFDKAKRFKEFVRLLTYGDDNVMGVSKAAPWFNHTAVQHQMQLIGVEYTMADKTSESVPYIHIKDVAYLKRTWRWDEDIGAVVCPLEEQSIRKMLTICVPSDTDSPEMHMASVMVAAANEWFWYGKPIFERKRAWLLKMAIENNLEVELHAKKFPTWDELVERFYNASKGLKTKRTEGCVVEHPRSLLPN